MRMCTVPPFGTNTDTPLYAVVLGFTFDVSVARAGTTAGRLHTHAAADSRGCLHRIHDRSFYKSTIGLQYPLACTAVNRSH